jgi:NAD(P)-dependent dehydrogenase (short-subunit alcohol dehydrogenase family)
MRLQNKIAIITGAASGIGRATALLFAQEGAKIAVVDIDAEEGCITTESITKQGGEAIFIEADLSQSKDAQRVVDETVQEYERVDILHNNAGILIFGNVVDSTEKQWDKTMTVNLKSAFLLSKYTIPEMIKIGGGSIVNTASVGGIVGAENASAYAASKGGMIQLTRSMALDYGPENIRVNCICPGSTETPMLRHVWQVEGQALGKDIDSMRESYLHGRPLRMIGTPEDMAYAALYLASDESRFVTGICLVVDGGVSAM